MVFDLAKMCGLIVCDVKMHENSAKMNYDNNNENITIEIEGK